MIRVERASKGHGGCCSCSKGAEIEMIYGIGQWPTSRSVVWFCRKCAYYLLKSLERPLGYEAMIIDQKVNSSDFRVVNKPKEKVVFRECHVEDDGMAVPSSETFKDIEC